MLIKIKILDTLFDKIKQPETIRDVYINLSNTELDMIFEQDNELNILCKNGNHKTFFIKESQIEEIVRKLNNEQS